MTVVSRPSADVHAHDLPSGYRSEVKRAGIEHHGFPFAPKWSMDSAIALMDHIGLATPHVDLIDRTRAGRARHAELPRLRVRRSVHEPRLPAITRVGVTGVRVWGN